MLTVKRVANNLMIRTTMGNDILFEYTVGIIGIWGFLIPFNTEWSAAELANAIEAYSTNVGAKFDARVLRRFLGRDH